MTELRDTNRAMFWRIVRRLLGANRGRLVVMLLALGAGGAVTAALLNLQVDAKRRLTTEFRTFGPNIIVAPRENSVHGGSPETLDESLLRRIPQEWYQRGIKVVPLLYLVAEAYKTGSDRRVPLVVAGKGGSTMHVGVNGPPFESLISCDVGTRVAAEMQLRPQEKLILQTRVREQPCNFNPTSATGGPEDDQVIVAMGAAQDLAALPGRAGMIELTEQQQQALDADPAVSRARCLPPASPGEPVRLLVVPEVKKPPQTLELDDFAVDDRLFAQLRNHLEPRRVLGTSIRIGTPYYQGVSVAVLVSGTAGRPHDLVRERALEALYGWINPLVGGPGGSGWPFDTDLTAGVIAEALAAVDGVDRVEEVVLFEADVRNRVRVGGGKELVRLGQDSLFLAFQHRVVVR